MSDAVVELENVTLARSGHTVLSELNWTVREGEVWAIVGPTGSGKTTLAELILGKHHAHTGHVRWPLLDRLRSRGIKADYPSQVIAHVTFKEESRLFSYVGHYYQQRFEFADSDEPLSLDRFLRTGTQATDADLLAVTARLGVSEHLTQPFMTLSNGQTRRARLARALLAKPELLILDDPFIGLDVAGRAELSALLGELVHDGKRLVLICREDMVPGWVTDVLRLEDPNAPAPIPEREGSTPSPGFAGEGRGEGLLGEPILNPPQLAAIEFSLAAKDVAIIHGPPGTGKTTTVVEYIRQSVARGDKVLACAPSNHAVDNLLEKLLAAGELPVRLGHPARVSPDLRARAIDILAEKHPDARQARKVARDAFALFRQADKWTRERPQPGEKASLRREAKEMLAEARKLETLAVERVLDEARVVCATLTGLDSQLLGQRRFDVVVIDEACQSTEPANWVPLLRSDRLVLAGDHCQLPPTIISNEAADEGLAISLMERLVGLFGHGVARLLTVQHRMHDAIMGFSNGEFYGGELIAHESVAAHRLCDLPGVRAEPLTETPVQFIDTAGASYDEELEEDTGSRRNVEEATLAARKVRQLLDAGVAATQIGVITPYRAQVRRLRELLAEVPGLEIDSVDGFQGREKEAIVVSLVRSNPEGEIGFLSDVRRTNVALTRARRKLLVIGDSATLANHEFYQRMLDHFEAIGATSSVWEESE